MATARPSRLSYGALAAGVGGLLLIISLFLDWASSGGFGINAFEILDIVDIFLFLVGLLAVGFAALEVTGAQVNLPFNRVRVLTVLGIIASSIVWSSLVEGENQAFGLFLAALSALAILAGGILAERAPGEGIDIGGAGAPGGGAPGGGIGAGSGFPSQGQPGGFGGAPAGGAPAPAATPAPAGSPAPPSAPGQPADWYPDPKGEKRLRYWDGSQWTDHVAD